MVDKYEISKLKGEFVCKETEKEYSLFYTQKNIETTKRLIIIFSLMNVLFIVPDYFVILDGELFAKMIAIRCIFFISFLLFYHWFSQSDNYANYFEGIMAIEFIAATSFLNIYWIYEPADFAIQVLGLITAITVFATVHNRWGYALLVNAYVIIGFFLITVFAGKEAETSTVITSAAYCIIISSMMLFRDYQVNIYKRKRYENNMKLRELSRRDSLTGILNRAAFEEEINLAIERWNRYGRVFSIAIFDIDNFKSVNDNYGHYEGDCVLRDLTAMITGEMRALDIFARWGGEEFVIILPETDAWTTLSFIERLRLKIKEKQFGRVKITCSFGVTQVRVGDTRKSLFVRVDDYLYICKRDGKDMVHHDLENEIEMMKSKKQKMM